VGCYLHLFVSKVVGLVVYEGMREYGARDGVEKGLACVMANAAV